MTYKGDDQWKHETDFRDKQFATRQRWPKSRLSTSGSMYGGGQSSAGDNVISLPAMSLNLKCFNVCRITRNC